MSCNCVGNTSEHFGKAVCVKMSSDINHSVMCIVLKSEKKQKYLLKPVSDASGDQKTLFKSLNRIMHRSNPNPMPDCEDPASLPDTFLSYFQSKIQKIRDRFSTDIEPAFEFDRKFDENSDIPTLSKFDPITEQDIAKVIAKSNSVSCELDPMPTFLIKQCQPQLLPVLTHIVNLSLATETMPSEYKRAIIRPLLKKPSLKREVKNYRPVSNLPYVSKLIERVVCAQVTKHMEHHALNEPLQSAYRAFHSPETALIKVFDNVLSHMDDGYAVFLTLLDLSAAFDTVDHRILLRRLRETIKIDGAAQR